MKSDGLCVALGLSSYRSDLQQTLLGKFNSVHRLDLFYNITTEQNGRSLHIQSVSRKLE